LLHDDVVLADRKANSRIVVKYVILMLVHPLDVVRCGKAAADL